MSLKKDFLELVKISLVKNQEITEYQAAFVLLQAQMLDEYCIPPPSASHARKFNLPPLNEAAVGFVTWARGKAEGTELPPPAWVQFCTEQG